MRGPRWAAAVLAPMLVAVGAAACGGGSTPTPSPATSGAPGTSSSPPTTGRPTPTTKVEAVTAGASVSPDQGAAGTTRAFTVEIRGPGTLIGEGVSFGDGAGSGANAGVVPCGDTARADHTSSYSHAYSQPGTYQFTDQVTVQSPPPACRFALVTARLTVVVAAPLSQATLNGAFLSPTKNIGCYINDGTPSSVRCATFTPPALVTMDAGGAFQTCTGSQCNLGNPAMETPVLPYGSATAGGPFQCLSTVQGMVCTVEGHKGFELSRAGVRTVG